MSVWEALLVCMDVCCTKGSSLASAHHADGRGALLIMQELGGLLLRAGKAAEGSKQLQACLEMQEQLFGGLSPELLPVLQLQVELLRRSRKFSEAEGVCQRALGICGAAFGPADVQVAVWKNQLAQVSASTVEGSELQTYGTCLQLSLPDILAVLKILCRWPGACDITCIRHATLKAVLL